MAINWEQRLSPIQGKPECTQSGSSVRQSTGRGVRTDMPDVVQTLACNLPIRKQRPKEGD